MSNDSRFDVEGFISVLVQLMVTMVFGCNVDLVGVVPNLKFYALYVCHIKVQL
jgi:hypothetical protein